MANPIIQLLNGNRQSNQNSSVNLIKTFLSGKNPQNLYSEMMRTNPQFRKFVEENKNKSIEDIALEYDIDLDILKQFF